MNRRRRFRPRGPAKPRAGTTAASARRRSREEEHRAQVELIAHVRTWERQHPEIADHLLAIPNGGYRTETTAKKMKAEGCRPGVHDLFLALPRHGYAGLWIEMKASHLDPERNGPGKPGMRYGTASAEQKAWAERMLRAGYAVAFAWTAAEAWAALTTYTAGTFEQRPKPWIRKP